MHINITSWKGAAPKGRILRALPRSEFVLRPMAATFGERFEVAFGSMTTTADGRGAVEGLTGVLL